MRDRPTLAMSAVVVGTYVVALYGAFGSSVSAKTIIPGKPPPRIMATTQPNHQPGKTPIADVTTESR